MRGRPDHLALQPSYDIQFNITDILLFLVNSCFLPRIHHCVEYKSRGQYKTTALFYLVSEFRSTKEIELKTSVLTSDYRPYY